MSLTKKTIEHEFLFRWNEAGHPQGCHIAYREAVLDDGVEIASRFLDPRPVALDDAPKLAEIGAAINTATLAALTVAQADAETARAALATVEAARDAAIAERDALIAQHATVDADGVPQAISPGQGELQLLREGLLDAVRAVLASPATPPEIQIAFNRATEWRRDSPSVIAMLQMLGKTDAEADAFFVAAAQIRL